MVGGGAEGALIHPSSFAKDPVFMDHYERGGRAVTDEYVERWTQSGHDLGLE